MTWPESGAGVVSGPQKRKRGPGKTAPLITLYAAYFTSAFFARILGESFCFFEQKRTRLLDRIDNQRSDR
jgi:hypothetical protein